MRKAVQRLKMFYVAISRARFEARVYTDDRAGLPVAIGRENGKFAAMDLKQKDIANLG